MGAVHVSQRERSLAEGAHIHLSRKEGYILDRLEERKEMRPGREVGRANRREDIPKSPERERRTGPGD